MIYTAFPSFTYYKLNSLRKLLMKSLTLVSLLKKFPTCKSTSN
nr:MAG TPA: hypothetical protein [Caudoviricetes sp.]